MALLKKIKFKYAANIEYEPRLRTRPKELERHLSI